MSNKPSFMKDKVLPFHKQPQGPVQMDLSREPGLYCPRCLLEGFVDVFGYKHVSRLMSPNGQEQIVKAQVGVLCVHCGWGGNMNQLKLMRPDEHAKAVDELNRGGSRDLSPGALVGEPPTVEGANHETAIS